MKGRLIIIGKWAAYPLFYLFCLGLFGYFTFPYDRLKDRLIAEFDRAQQKRPGATPQRLEIDELDAYWFTGVEVKGARLILPPAGDTQRPSFDASAKEEPKPSVIEIDEAHARVKVLPLLLGRVRVSFWASIFDGEVEGVVPVGKAGGAMEVELSNVDLGKVEPLVDALGLPLRGAVNGKLTLEAPGGVYKKANGSLELSASDVSVGDGKTKIQGLILLPEAKLGELALSAIAKDGVLKIEKLSANGVDLELAGEGKFNVREPWLNSGADLYVRFKFSDAYRNKSDATKSLLGSPGSTMPALIEMQQPKMKRAKRADGFYGWHVHGQLKRLRFDPHAADAPGARSRGTKGDAAFSPPTTGIKKPGGLNLPLGPSEASPPRPAPREDDDAVAPPPPPPPPPPAEREPEREEPMRMPEPPPVELAPSETDAPPDMDPNAPAER